MESIDALAKAVNEFEGGLVLVSHDMRLISQVAKEIWICDNKTITRYRGDIMNFKMDMRAQMGIANDTSKLRGDASVKATDKPKKEKAPKKEEPKLEVVKPMAKIEETALKPEPVKQQSAPLTDDSTASTSTTSNSGGSGSAPKRYIPPHLRKKMAQG